LYSVFARAAGLQLQMSTASPLLYSSTVVERLDPDDAPSSIHDRD